MFVKISQRTDAHGRIVRELLESSLTADHEEAFRAGILLRSSSATDDLGNWDMSCEVRAYNDEELGPRFGVIEQTMEVTNFWDFADRESAEAWYEKCVRAMAEVDAYYDRTDVEDVAQLLVTCDYCGTEFRTEIVGGRLCADADGLDCCQECLDPETGRGREDDDEDGDE